MIFTSSNILHLVTPPFHITVKLCFIFSQETACFVISFHSSFCCFFFSWQCCCQTAKVGKISNPDWNNQEVNTMSLTCCNKTSFFWISSGEGSCQVSDVGDVHCASCVRAYTAHPRFTHWRTGGGGPTTTLHCSTNTLP